ncbi:cytochrome C oxidase subunit IV family protein [Zavarzinia aquatilis]|nr:cytochrome C oxidase subunit IV family protein [Zavarzinia aquatilis]
MRALLLHRLSAIWLLLVLATVASWEIGHGLGISDHRLASVAIVVVAMIKVRFVALDFMELRDAPLAFRVAANLWTAGIAAGLSAMILTA